MPADTSCGRLVAGRWGRCRAGSISMMRASNRLRSELLISSRRVRLARSVRSIAICNRHRFAGVAGSAFAVEHAVACTLACQPLAKRQSPQVIVAVRRVAGILIGGQIHCVLPGARQQSRAGWLASQMVSSSAPRLRWLPVFCKYNSLVPGGGIRHHTDDAAVHVVTEHVQIGLHVLARLPAERRLAGSGCARLEIRVAASGLGWCRKPQKCRGAERFAPQQLVVKSSGVSHTSARRGLVVPPKRNNCRGARRQSKVQSCTTFHSSCA